MNVALPALVVFFLLLPGFLFRSRFKRAELTSLDYSPFGQVATEAVLWSCAIHALWLTLTWLLFARVVDVGTLLRLMSSDPVGQSRAAGAVAADASRIAAYFATVLAGAYLVPMLARQVITRWRLDRFGSPFYRMFRFHQAPWHYLLTGADFPRDGQPDLISISAVVSVAGEPVLYRGFLDEFFVGPDGTLDRLVLQDVMRRPLARDKAADAEEDDFAARFYPIEGDYFVLRYSEAVTLNVQYVKLLAT